MFGDAKGLWLLQWAAQSVPLGALEYNGDVCIPEPAGPFGEKVDCHERRFQTAQHQ